MLFYSYHVNRCVNHVHNRECRNDRMQDAGCRMLHAASAHKHEINMANPIANTIMCVLTSVCVQ